MLDRLIEIMQLLRSSYTEGDRNQIMAALYLLRTEAQHIELELRHADGAVNGTPAR